MLPKKMLTSGVNIILQVVYVLNTNKPHVVAKGKRLSLISRMKTFTLVKTWLNLSWTAVSRSTFRWILRFIEVSVFIQIFTVV